MANKIYLYISSYFPTPEEQSSCTFVYNQAAAIKRARPEFEVRVINTNYDGDYVYKGVRVFGFKQFTSGRWVCPWMLDRINLYRFSQTLKRAKIDPIAIIIAHGHLIGSAAYLNCIKRRNNSIKTLLQFHDSDPYGMMFGDGLHGLKRISYFLYHRYQAKKVSAFVAISEKVAQVAREAPHQSVFNTYPPMQRAMRELSFFKPTKCPPIILLHNGVNSRLFKKSVRNKTGEFTIGCVGVFRDLKDQMTLLKAVKLLQNDIPNLNVQFVRGGPTLAACKQYAHENKIPAEFIGEMPQSELNDFYAKLDLFVLPSYFEGFGCVFLEANACGVPFITCEGQGIEDMISSKERHLWLCKQQDPQDLADKIAYFFNHRPVQHIAAETDIDKLIPKFLNEVDALKG